MEEATANRGLTLEEAALDVCGLDVLPVPIYWKSDPAGRELKRTQLRDYNQIRAWLEAAVRERRLRANVYAGHEIRDIDPQELWELIRAEDPQWQITEQLRGRLPGASASSTSTWPVYTNARIELLKRAIAVHWEHHDPQAPPKAEVIVHWLKAQGATDNIARAIDAIIRSDSARAGRGNPERKRTT